MRYLLFLLLIIIPLSSFPQILEISSGEVLDREQFKENEISYREMVIKNSSRNTFFDSLEKVAYVGMGARDKQYIFSTMKNYVTLAGTKVIRAEVPATEEMSRIQGFIEKDKRRFIIHSTYNKTRQQETAYVNELSKDFTLMGTPLKLAAFSSAPTLIQSQNKKSFLLINIKSSKTSSELECVVLDDNFNQLWKKSFIEPTLRKEENVYSVDLDNAGNLYYISYRESDDKKRYPLVKRYLWKDNESKDVTIQRTGAQIYACNLEIVDGKNVVVAGMYQEKKDVGYFFTSLSSGDIKTPKIFFYALNDTYRSAAERQAFDPEYYGVRNIVKVPWGYALSIECNLNVVKADYTMYLSSPVYLAGLKEDGSKIWERTIFKVQTVLVNPYTHSHALMASGQHVWVLYNDHEWNASLPADQEDVRLFRAENVVVMAQRFDASGNVEKQIVKTGKPEEFSLYPRYVQKISDGLFHSQLTNLKFRHFEFSYATLRIKGGD
jgi:hypothetical protein